MVSLNEVPYRGSQGIYTAGSAVPDSLSRLSELSDPDVAQAFDSDGDGKGEIWVGERGWASTTRLHDLIDREFPNLEAEEYSETIFKARLEDFGRDGKPLLFYGYRPDWIHEMARTHSIHDLPATQAEDRCWSDSTLPCRQGTVSVHIAHNSSVSTSHPDVSRFLQDAQFSQRTVNDFILQVDKNGREPRDVAAAWLANNDKTVNNWWGENN